MLAAVLEQRMSLLPALDLPRISHRERLSERATRGLDALLAIVPERAQQKLFAQLPESERWRRLYESPKPVAGAVRSGTLGAAGATRAVLGVLRADASVFDTLALAGRMLKEL